MATSVWQCCRQNGTHSVLELSAGVSVLSPSAFCFKSTFCAFRPHVDWWHCTGVILEAGSRHCQQGSSSKTLITFQSVKRSDKDSRLSSGSAPSHIVRPFLVPFWTVNRYLTIIVCTSSIFPQVAQLSGYVAEHSAYHHGEQSLHSTIVWVGTGLCGLQQHQPFVSIRPIRYTPAGSFKR